MNGVEVSKMLNSNINDDFLFSFRIQYYLFYCAFDFFYSSQICDFNAFTSVFETPLFICNHKYS